jgi:hypothetical protein
MPFPSALSAGQITQVRKTSQFFRQFLLFCPNDIIWQTQPDENISDTVYADFAWTGTLQGDRADVKEGMTVLITTSDSDLSTVVYRGRVRTIPDASTFYINETSATLSTAYYVTVLNDYDIFEKLERRTVDGTAYKDWDLTFSQLPPLITGLQSVYVDISGSATADFDFTVAADATAQGATISTYVWDVDDGTINSGAGTATINVTFPGYATNEHRWVVLTVTDSNGTANYFAFEVYTVSLADVSTNVIALKTGDVSVSGNLDEGFNLSVRAWDGLSSILDNTRCALLSVDNYDDTTTPITQNVSFVGRLRQDSSNTTGDQRYGSLKDTRLTIEGFVSQLGRLHGAGLYLKTDSTPTAWGEVDALTIKRAIVYMLAWHSTFLNVSGLTFDADSDDYQWPEYVIEEASLLEWVNSVADDYNTQLIIAADGQSTFQRDARITGVAGLTTIYDFVTGDILNFALDYETISTYSQAIVGAATYNTTTADSTVYQGRAPAQAFGPGWETTPLNQQIMKADLTDAQARTETGTRVANYFATVNPRPRITAELKTGFYWLIPTVHQLYTFTLAASDTTRGRAYTTADKWLCTQVDYSYNVERGYYIVNATFELIVAGGASGIQVTLVPDIDDLRLPILPGISAGFGDLLDPLINYPTDTPDFTIPGGDAGLTQPGPYQPQPQPGCEILNISMKTGSIVTTSNNTVFGEPYTVTVEGQAIVETASDNWTRLYAFDEDDLEGWAVVQGQWATAFGLYSTVVAGTNQAATDHNYIGFDGLTRVAFYMRWDLTVKAGQTCQFTTTSDFGTEVDAVSVADESWREVTLPAARDNVTYLKIQAIHNTANQGGSVGILQIRLQGTGSNPPPGTTISSDDLYGDAFYYGYNVGNTALYPSSNGFQVDSARPTGLQTYQPSHQYTFVVTGTGAPLGFRFLDSDYSDNNNNQLTVTVCGQGMAQG